METPNINSSSNSSKDEKESQSSEDTNYELPKKQEFSIEQEEHEAIEERILGFLEINGLERKNPIDKAHVYWQKKKISFPKEIKAVPINFSKKMNLNLSCDLYKRRKTNDSQN